MVPERRAAVPQQLKSVDFDAPEAFLQWLEQPHTMDAVWLDDFNLLHPWALVALAARATAKQHPIEVLSGSKSSAARFAHAMGFDALVEGVSATTPREELRTPVSLQSIAPYPNGFLQTGNIASAIVDNLFYDTGLAWQQIEGASSTMKYVLVELLRNAVQHSHDSQGGIVIAQRMSSASTSRLQVAVADRGIGILQALSSTHRDLADAHVAIQRALQPHVSGTFAPGDTGSRHNAGLGLYMSSEMAKHTGSKMLIATRGGSIMLRGDENASALRQQALGAGFAGTLVAFEMPVSYIDYDALLESISAKAKETIPGTTTGALRFVDDPPQDALRISVRVASENAIEAADYAENQLIPRLMAKEKLLLDFGRFETLTQSFAHALLYEAIRIAWARKNPIFIIKAKPSVRIALAFVESYALG